MKTIVAFNIPQREEIITHFGLDIGGRTQKVIDSAFMSYLEPYMPKDTGTMIDLMFAQNQPGKGEININVPYAQYVYDGVSVSGKPLNYQGAPMRGANYVDRMLADHFNDILTQAQKEVDR